MWHGTAVPARTRTHPSTSLPTSPPPTGQFNEQVLAGLDWLLVQAGQRGLSLMLTLTNYWGEYGGMPQYVRCGGTCRSM
jgi:endo-1,4-beta-mannosidase